MYHGRKLELLHMTAAGWWGRVSVVSQRRQRNTTLAEIPKIKEDELERRGGEGKDGMKVGGCDSIR